MLSLARVEGARGVREGVCMQAQELKSLSVGDFAEKGRVISSGLQRDDIEVKQGEEKETKAESRRRSK